MSTGYRCRAHVLWITLQLLVFANPDPRAAMAFAHFTPYVSEFEYSSRFHPSKNPHCPTSGWADNSERDFGSRRYRRSPEEGSPVGQEPSIEVRAILVRCPKTSDETDDVPINRNVYNITAGRSQDILDFHGFDRDEPAHHSEVHDCRRKLIVTMKFNNIGRTKTQEEFVVIDHVLDPITMHKARLLNPFVVKVRQEPVLQLYGLKFQGVVNAEAREEVINKKWSNYTGCDDASDNPTCGQMIFEGKPIPYSQGFCCSCDPELNVQRQASLLNESVVSSFPSFFSKSRDIPIRPFKSPRSVSSDIRDTFGDSDETENVVYPDEQEKEDTPRFSSESLANSKSAGIGENRFVLIGHDNSTIVGSHNDEQDLIKLKHTRKIKKENRYRPIWKTIFGEPDDKTTAAPQVVFSPPGSSRQRSDSSNSESSPRPGKKSFSGDRSVDPLSESRSSAREVFSNYRRTTERYRSPYQNQRSVNLAAELTKLEEDYKNLRLSSIMRAVERNNEARDRIPVYKSVWSNSAQRSFDIYDDGRKLIGQPARTSNQYSRIANDYRQEHGPTLGREMPSLEDGFHGRGPTLSIDVKLAVRTEEKSTTPPPSTTALSADTCSRRTSHPATTTSPPETQTPAVLRQKLVSDRVYPSGVRANVSLERSHPTEATESQSQKLDGYVADLLADAVMFSSDEEPFGNDTETTLEEIYRETSSVNSITESSVPFEGTAKYLHGTEYQGANIDNPSDRAESPSDSHPSFSSGNISREDAILLSGSLKNQLANWLPHEERNSSAVKSARSKLKEQHNVDPASAPEETDNPAEGHVRYEDRSTSVVADRRPVQVYLGADEAYDSSAVGDDEKPAENPRQREGKALANVFLDYPGPGAMIDLAPEERSRQRNPPRSHRSIEDEALFVKDNDRQRGIDKRIDDEFEEISDALKEAADAPKIVRQRPKSESTFEQDDSLVRKFATMFGQTELLKHTEPSIEPVSDVMLTTGHRIVVDRFKIVNDFREIPIARTKLPQKTASTYSVRNSPSRMRDRKQGFPVTSITESATLIGNETRTRSLSEIVETTNYRIMVDRLELVENFNAVVGRKSARERTSTRKSSPEVPSTPISTSRSKVATFAAGISHRNAPSPVLTIEKLKKELREEVERYSSVSPAGSPLGEPRMHSAAYNEVREVNTELTPAERVEDSITDEETLPPDEETERTTEGLSKISHVPSTSSPTTWSMERSTIDEGTFTRLGIQRFDARFVDIGRDSPLKRTNELLVLVEETSRPPRRGDNGVRKKRRHRSRGRRHGRHKKRSIESKGNVGDRTTVRYIVRGGSENEDDEHPWYEATTKFEATEAKDRNDPTTKTLAGTTQQNRKRRSDLEASADSRESGKIDWRSTESPNDPKLRFTAGKFYVSITRIPENENRAGAAGLRIQEIPKVIGEESNLGSDSDEAMISSIKWPDNSSEVDEMPIFPDTRDLGSDDGSDGRGAGETIGRSRRNLQTYPARNSLRNVRPADGGAHGEVVGRNNKRNYAMDSHEPEAQIFYDYEDSEAESAADGGNDENSRSLDSVVRNEVNPVSDKKYLGGVGENGDESSVKSSEIMRRGPDRRLIVERRGSQSLNHRLDGREEGEEENGRVSDNAELFAEDIVTESSASLHAEEGGGERCSDNQFGIEPSDGWKEKMELLKLKKHADVLKEYLNWRQDVAPPEPHGMPGYTTMISPANPKEEQTSDFFTTDNVQASDDASAVSSTASTDYTVAEGFTSTPEQRTDVTDFTVAQDDRYAANGTTISGSIETSVILGADDRSATSLADLSTTVVRTQTSMGCPANKTVENFRQDDETSTGRILPPCGYQIGGASTCPMEHANVTQLSTLNTPPNMTRDHQAHLSDIDRDLIIISVIEKNLLKNKTRFTSTKQDERPKVHRAHDNVASAQIIQQHHRRHKSKNNEIPVGHKIKNIGYNRRAGRQLMALEDTDEENNPEEYDSMFEDEDENRYLGPSSEKNTSKGDEGNSEEWTQKWNQIIEKIIHENSSIPWNPSNSSGLSLKAVPGESRSALQQLHIKNADKYIRQIAKNIVRNTNIHERKRKKDRPATRREASRRKLHSYPMARRKVVRKADSVEDFGNYEDKRSAPRLGSLIDDSRSARGDSPDRRAHPAPRSAEATGSSPTDPTEQEKLGRDFAISLSGKIHVEGGTNGQPMSISFDTAPEKETSGNSSAHAHQNGSSAFDNGTKTDGETSPNTNFLSSLFNIASVPKEPPHHAQVENGNSSADAPIRQSVRDVDAESSRYSRENGRQKFPSLSRKYPKVRKSRAVDEEALERSARHRDHRSYDLGRSRESEDTDEGDQLEDYSESLNDDDYSDLAEYNGKMFVSGDRSLKSRGSCPEVNGSPAAEHLSLNRPEVQVIKIIPLNEPRSHASLSSMVPKHQDAKASRMTASQLPKAQDDSVPGTTVKPSKIAPAELPGRGSNDEASNPMLDTMEENDFPSKSSGSCSSDGNRDELDARKELLDARKNYQIPTSSPVSLKVIGLVGMREPSRDSTGNANVNADHNYAIIPLVHMKIEQHSENREGSAPGSVEDGSPDMETMNPSEDLRDDEQPCSKSNVQGEDNMHGPEVATMSMENDEELREPIDIGSCPESNRKDVETLKDDLEDCKLDRTQQSESANPIVGNQETTPKMRLENAPDESESRKRIRLKNMLAIMRFMKKIKEIINGEEAPELPSRDDKNIVIKLDRVIVLPNNRSFNMQTKIDEPVESTDRIVMIGEGVRHKPSTNGIYFEKNFHLSDSKGSNEAASPQVIDADFNETESGNGSSGAHWRTSERDQDKSFLFYGERDKLGAVNQSIVKDSKDRQFSPVDRGNENPDRPNEEEGSEEAHRPKIRLIEMLKNSRKVIDPENDFSPASGADSSNPSAVPNNSESKDGVAMRNFERIFDDRLRSLKNRALEENGREDGVNNLALIPKTKRYRSPMRLRSNRMRYDLRKERDAKSQIYRRRSLPTGREVSRFSGRKFGRYAAAKGVPKEKRAKKKKKKKRRRKKKKKRKRKKGKNHREAAVKGRAWWPFGRQLMSASEEREIISDSNFDRSQLERIKTKRHRDRRVSLPFAARAVRRVHRAKYPHGKNKKKRRKHKKGKRRKKKKKSKGRKDGKKSSSRSKRQIRPGGTQVRGGQDCMDRRHPPDVNPAKYLESAHCLRFSDMWYSVYELESPITEHTVYLQLFEKHSLEDGTTHWDDLTQGTMVRMGTFTRHQRDSKPTIVFTYSGAKTESQKRALNLDPAKQRLLVPSPIPPKKSSQYREVRSGLGEYLVVQANAISKDGNDCDKAGVGFAAFSKQEDRCGRAKGSCLRNQPLAYWRHDTEARESGRRGCYFLSNFASVPTNPIKYNVSGSGSREYLGLEYHSAHVSAIDIEVRTDYNAIVRVGSSGRVTEVYVDSTAPDHTVVTVVISNMGLTSSPYQPRITDCPTGLPVSWTRSKGIMQVIPPQHDQRVTLDLYGQLSINGFHCSVEVVNHRGELVAMRRIRVQKMDRCFCVWHCLCACIGSVSGMGCQPMSPEHYHAAGFQGPVPVVTTETSILMNAVKDVLMLSALLVLLLLLLGILKWFVGMFVPAVGRWGLDSLLEGSKIEKYLEPELKCRCVVTDGDGAPVHPDTGQRTVRICSRKLEFVLNFIFFLTYPIAVCCGYFRRSLNASRQRNCCPDESKICLINEKGSCPKMICVSTYGDSRDSKLEAEDTRYVMNELKKSQESLENPKRTKKKDAHRNGSGKNLSKKSSHKNKSASDVIAKRFVEDLLKRRIVFRNLTEPVGGLSVPTGTAYCLRGYFLNAEDGGYRFITPCPFKQHWLIVNNQKKASKPPETHPSNHFMRSFGTARDVYESNELSLTPQGICVNVQYLEDR